MSLLHPKRQAGPRNHRAAHCHPLPCQKTTASSPPASTKEVCVAHTSRSRAGAGVRRGLFNGGSATTRYEIPTVASGALVVKAELLYLPVGFRWVHNLAPYQVAEPQRFVSYYEAASGKSALVLAQGPKAAPSRTIPQLILIRIQQQKLGGKLRILESGVIKPKIDASLSPKLDVSF